MLALYIALFCFGFLTYDCINLPILNIFKTVDRFVERHEKYLKYTYSIINISVFIFMAYEYTYNEDLHCKNIYSSHLKWPWC